MRGAKQIQMYKILPYIEKEILSLSSNQITGQHGGMEKVTPISMGGPEPMGVTNKGANPMVTNLNLRCKPNAKKKAPTVQPSNGQWGHRKKG